MKKDPKKQDPEKQEDPTQALQYVEQLQRLQAEFINYRNRVEKEKLLLLERAKESVLLRFLEVKDNFERAPKLDQGMQMIYEQFLTIFKEEGVEETPTECFNPEQHEAIATDPETEQGKIAKVIEKGYMYNTHVMKPARVIVGAKTMEVQENE